MSVDPQNLGTPIYNAINGKEARQILIHDATDKINGITRFKEGAAFHRLHIVYAMTCTAFPADNPVPTLEYEIARSAKGFDENADYIQQKDKITALETKRADLIKGIERIDQILSVIRPVIEIEGDLDAGNIPDNLRIAHGLKVPRLVRTTDVDGMVSSAEKYVEIAKT